jgi:hypothetical protein
MIIIAQPGLWLIGMFLLAGIVFLCGFVAIQTRSEPNDLSLGLPRLLVLTSARLDSARCI